MIRRLHPLKNRTSHLRNPAFPIVVTTAVYRVPRREISYKIRTCGSVALVRQDFSPVPISTISVAKIALAARLEDPFALLGGLLQTGDSISSRPFSERFESDVDPASAVIASIRNCRFRAQLPEPQTVRSIKRTPGDQRFDCPLKSGDRCALRHSSIGQSTPASTFDSRSSVRTSGLGSQNVGRCFGRRLARVLAPPALAATAIPRINSDPLDHARPFNPSSLLPLSGLRADRIGGDHVSPSCGNSIQRPALIHSGTSADLDGLNVSPVSRRDDLSSPSGNPPLPNVIEQSDFPWKSRLRVSAVRKCSVLRGSGPLRNAFASQILNLIK